MHITECSKSPGKAVTRYYTHMHLIMTVKQITKCNCNGRINYKNMHIKQFSKGKKDLRANYNKNDACTK